MEKVSVIIVNWNVAKSLEACLSSIFATNYANLEVIVVDNNSSNDSLQVLKKYPKVNVIKNMENLGFPKAVNQGFEKATGEYILLLNPDTRLPKDFFTKSINFINTHTDTGVMGPKLVNPDGTVQGSVFDEPSVFGANEKYSPNSNKPIIVNAVSGACMFLRTKTVNQIGPMTEEVFMYYEDLDYCRRIRKMGLKVYFNPNIKVVHEHGQSAKKNREIGDWRGQLWKSSIWYNGPLKHYMMWVVSIVRQKLNF